MNVFEYKLQMYSGTNNKHTRGRIMGVFQDELRMYSRTKYESIKGQKSKVIVDKYQIFWILILKIRKRIFFPC